MICILTLDYNIFDIFPTADHDYSRYPQEILTAILSATLRVIRGADWRYGNQDGGPGGVGTILLTPSPGFVRVRWDNGQMHDYRMGASGAFDLYLFAGRVPSRFTTRTYTLLPVSDSLPCRIM